MQDYVAAGNAAAGGGISQVVRSQRRVDGGVHEMIGRSQTLVHRVDQATVILDRAVGAVPVPHGIRDTPDSALRVAAHAVLAEEA